MQPASIWSRLLSEGAKTRKSRVMSEDILSPYIWIEVPRWVASCISFVKGNNEDQVIRCFGGDPATAVQMTLDEGIESGALISDYASNEFSVLVGRLGEWVVVYEENGFQGSRHEVWRRASQGTEMVTVFWNVNWDNEFIYAVNGEPVMTFDMVIPEERAGSDPDRFMDYMLELPFDGELAKASALALAGRITGVPFEADWLKSKHRVVKIIALPQESYDAAL
jgi:hypothetical protein